MYNETDFLNKDDINSPFYFQVIHQNTFFHPFHEPFLSVTAIKVKIIKKKDLLQSNSYITNVQKSKLICQRDNAGVSPPSIKLF